jgi:hypothetical protein
MGTKIRTMPMIDSGCTHMCIGEKMVKKENIPTQKLVKSMTARNADGLVTVTTLRVNSGCNERQRLEGNKAKSKLVKRKEYRVLLRYL